MLDELSLNSQKAREELEQILFKLKLNANEELTKEKQQEVSQTNSKTIRKMSYLTTTDAAKKEESDPLIKKISDIMNGIFK